MANFDDLRSKSDELRKTLRSIDQMTGRDDERERDAERKQQKREAKRLVVIPPCANRERRERLEADDIAWLMHYFGTNSEVEDPYWYEFTAQQREMAEAIASVFHHGGDQAIAASRGEGKTTLFERLGIKYILQGKLSFLVIGAATGPLAQNSLDTIRSAFEENPLLLADYPEACFPVHSLEGIAQRAGSQLVSGHRHDTGEPFTKAKSKFRWKGNEIYLPNVPGSPSARAIIATRGLDTAIRGLKKRGRRPQVVAIDDPDTPSTVANSDMATALENRIESDIGGLGTQQLAVGRIMLTTLQSRSGGVSYRYTDPKQKPSFRGKRYRFLLHAPERTDLWEEYVRIRHEEQRALAAGDSEDEHCRKSHAFYLANREAMDAGAIVANPNRFNSKVLPDGTQVEVSSLQRYYNEVARLGAVAVATEYDNDPPEETGPVESGITPHRIQRQLSGYARRLIAPGCTVLVQGIDVRKVALHCVVRAFRPDATAFTIDYGVHEVLGTTYGSEEGLEVAIEKAILSRIEETKSTAYKTIDGKLMEVNLTLIDAGWQTNAVYSACKKAGLGVMPIMGFGRSAGCVKTNFTEAQSTTPNRKPGDGWFMSKQGKPRSRVWLVCADADRWKRYEHDRWLTSPARPGCNMLFGEPSGVEQLSADEKMHHSYAHHVCNEVEEESVVKGKLVRNFRAKSDNVHYMDASYYTDVGANMLGIRLLSEATASEAQPPAAGGWFDAQKSSKRRAG